MFNKFLINTRVKQEMPGVELWTCDQYPFIANNYSGFVHERFQISKRPYDLRMTSTLTPTYDSQRTTTVSHIGDPI